MFSAEIPARPLHAPASRPAQRCAPAAREPTGASTRGRQSGPAENCQLGHAVPCMAQRPAPQHRARIAQAQQRHRRRIGQHLGRRARRAAPARPRSATTVRGQPRHLGQRVADIQDRHPGLVAQPFEIGQDLGLARARPAPPAARPSAAAAGSRQQRPPDRDPLPFAARQRRRAAVSSAPMPRSRPRRAATSSDRWPRTGAP